MIAAFWFVCVCVAYLVAAVLWLIAGVVWFAVFTLQALALGADMLVARVMEWWYKRADR